MSNLTTHRSSSNDESGTVGPAAPQWTALIGFAILIFGYLTLVLTGHDGNDLLQKGITVAGFFGLAGLSLDNRRVLKQVSNQTNGVLDQRIADQVRHELRTQLHPDVLKGGGGTSGT